MVLLVDEKSAIGRTEYCFSGIWHFLSKSTAYQVFALPTLSLFRDLAYQLTKHAGKDLFLLCNSVAIAIGSSLGCGERL